MNENICDSQSKTKRASKEKNKVTEDSLIDLGNVITGHDIVSELTHEEMYYYPTKQYCPIDQNSLFKNNVSKEEKPKI